MIKFACYAVYRGADLRLMNFYRLEALRNSTLAIGIDIMFIKPSTGDCTIRSALSSVRGSLSDLLWYLKMLRYGHLILPLPAFISFLGLWIDPQEASTPPCDTVAALYSLSWPNEVAANEIMSTYLRFICTLDEVYGLKPYDRRFLRMLKRWRIYQVLANTVFRILRPNLYLAMHSGYLHHQTPCEAAARYSVPILVLGCNDCLYRMSDSGIPTTFSFANYNELNLPKGFPDISARGSKILEQRIRGSYDHVIPYMKTSAYESASTQGFWAFPSVSNILQDITATAMLPDTTIGFVTVFMHEFDDWHHNGVLPPFATSYYHWLLITLLFLRSQNIPYVLKIHPCIVNYPERYSSSIRALLALSIQLRDRLRVTTALTTIQLIDAGMKLGVTVRGTVALELAYLKAPFLCAGRPPFAELFPNRIELNLTNYYQRLLNFSTEVAVSSTEASLAAYYVAMQERGSAIPNLDMHGSIPKLADDQSFALAKSYL